MTWSPETPLLPPDAAPPWDISALPEASELTGNELIMLSQNGVLVKTTLAAILSMETPVSLSNQFNLQAFQPYNGGEGLLIPVTTSASAAVLIPGTLIVPDPTLLRILICGDPDTTVSIRFGNADVEATLASTRILRDTQPLLTPPALGGDGIWISAICEEGTATIQVTSGTGT